MLIDAVAFMLVCVAVCVVVRMLVQVVGSFGAVAQVEGWGEDAVEVEGVAVRNVLRMIPVTIMFRSNSRPAAVAAASVDTGSLSDDRSTSLLLSSE